MNQSVEDFKHLFRWMALLSLAVNGESMSNGVMFAVVLLMSLCSLAGGMAFKYFALSKDVLWLVGGFALYTLSNVAFITIMSETGLARAIILGSAFGIILNICAGLYFRENLQAVHFLSAALACLAILLPLLGSSSTKSATNTYSKVIQTQGDK